MNYEELKRLLDAATPGPWGVWLEPIQNRDDAISELTEQVQATDNLSDALVLLDAGGKCPCTTGCGTESEANAALIVHLVNNAPAILALVEENARLRATNTRLYTIILENRADTTIADNGMTVWDGLQNEARQALGEPK